MSDERKPIFSAFDNVLRKGPELDNQLEKQKADLQLIKEIAERSNKLGIDMTAIEEFADMGQKAIDALKAQLDKIAKEET